MNLLSSQKKSIEWNPSDDPVILRQKLEVFLKAQPTLFYLESYKKAKENLSTMLKSVIIVIISQLGLLSSSQHLSFNILLLLFFFTEIESFRV